MNVRTISAALPMLAIFGLTVACTANDSDAETAFPERNMEVLVGFGAGGGSDLYARQLAERIQDVTDVNVRVVNMEGAGGANAIIEAHNREPDGHTLVADPAVGDLIATGELDAFEMVQPVARMQNDINQVFVDPNRFEDWDTLVEASQTDELRVGTTGGGGVQYVITQELVAETDLNATVVPFDGAGELLAALLSGNIDMAIAGTGLAIEQVESGDLIPVLAFDEDGMDEFPEVPTSSDHDIEIYDGVSRGVLAHIDTDEEIIEELEDIMRQVYESEEYKEYEENSHLHYREGWLGSEDYMEERQNYVERATPIFEERD